MNEYILRPEERAILALRELYQTYGYAPYKMEKFEEYDYYLRNRDFLTSHRIITFQDTNGRLLAMKPDVTLSIVKNGMPEPGVKRKLCYNESVYRISDTTGRYREIPQTGLECIGPLDLYDLYEVITLAAGSLSCLGGQFILQISHLGILGALLEEASVDPQFCQQATALIAEKNCHDLKKLCDTFRIPADRTSYLSSLVEISGDRHQALAELEALRIPGGEEAVRELQTLSQLLDDCPWGDRVIFDFSVVNDMHYYNGLVFNGFVEGISSVILTGGQYHNLMKKLGHDCGGIGFAVYLDQMDAITPEARAFDVDVLILYGEDTSSQLLARTAADLTGQGRSVMVQRVPPRGLRWRELVRL